MVLGIRFPALTVLCLAVIINFLPFTSISKAYAQLACIHVNQVQLSGVTLLSADQQKEMIKPFEGQCLGIPAINKVLETVTLSYVDKGYITARAYLPEQDLSDGVLEVRVVEGTLSDIRFNGEVNRRWQNIVFPQLVGQPVHLRQIEQGLDIIRSMPSYTAEMNITAGDQEGASILDVTAVSQRPFRLRFSTNNHGLTNKEQPGSAASTGQYISSLNMSYDHLLGLNETWLLDLSRSFSRFPLDFWEGGPKTQNAKFGVRFPYGRWKFDAGFEWSDYNTTQPGANDDLDAEGWSYKITAGAERLMHRDRNSKTYLSALLLRQQHQNKLDDIVLISSSRIVSTGRLNLKHERVLKGGQLSARLGIEQGLPLFGAEKASEMPDHQPDAQFTLIDGDVSYIKPFRLGALSFMYMGAASGQWSPDRLYGAQQLSLGGVSTVRGIKTSVMSGNTGILLRNDLIWTTPAKLPKMLGQLQLYSALDWGWIKKQVPLGVVGGDVTGAAIGMRLSGGRFNLDVSYSRLLDAPYYVEDIDDVFLFSFGARF